MEIAGWQGVASRRGPEESLVIACAEDLQQSGMCRFLYQSDELKTLKSLRPHAVQKLRETAGRSCVTLKQSGWRCGKTLKHETVE